MSGQLVIEPPNKCMGPFWFAVHPSHRKGGFNKCGPVHLLEGIKPFIGDFLGIRVDWDKLGHVYFLKLIFLEYSENTLAHI